MSALDIALVYLLFAVAGVVACRLLHLPALLGYLIAGVFLSQGGALVHENESVVASLAEMGVVLLMFVIGLEFNLPKLLRLKKMVFGFGMAQVLVMVLGTLLGHLLLFKLLTFWQLPWDLTWQGAVVLGAAMAMSSTAIVVKLMAERSEIDSQHGRRVIGALLFQDLAVVPLLVLIPALGRMNEGNVWSELGWALAKACVLVGLLLWGGQRIMRRWLEIVDRRNSDELFMLNILLMTLGLAWLTEHAGLSLAMGSFLAGMLIAETDFKQRVEDDIRPFHDVLLGLFFITLGMKLDWHVLQVQWPWVLVLAVIPVLVKAFLITILAYAGGASNGVAARTGIYLAQAGEFGFVLLTLGLDNALIDPRWSNPVLAAMVLSMMATPMLIQNADRLIFRFSPDDWMAQSLQITRVAKESIGIDHHVIVCGFGNTGRHLCQLLEMESVSYIALDVNPDVVKAGVLAGHHVEVGDSFQLSYLMSAGLARASAVVVSFDDTPTALRVLDLIKQHMPHVPVIVRTRFDKDMAMLKAAGATEVIPDAFEVSLSLATHTLTQLGLPVEEVNRLVLAERRSQYTHLKEPVVFEATK